MHSKTHKVTPVCTMFKLPVVAFCFEMEYVLHIRDMEVFPGQGGYIIPPASSVKKKVCVGGGGEGRLYFELFLDDGPPYLFGS